MVVRTTAGAPTDVPLPHDKRMKLYYAAIKAVLVLYQRPSLLTIPITGIRDRNALRNTMLHGAAGMAAIASSGSLARQDV